MPCTKYEICMGDRKLIEVYTENEVKMYISVLVLLDKDLSEYKVKVYDVSETYGWEFVYELSSVAFS